MAQNETRSTAMTWLAIVGVIVVALLGVALIAPFFMQNQQVAQDQQTQNEATGVGGPEEELITDPSRFTGAASGEAEELEGRDVLLTNLEVSRVVNDSAFIASTPGGDVLVIADEWFLDIVNQTFADIQEGNRVNIEGELELTTNLDPEGRDSELQGALTDRQIYIEADEVNVLQ